MIVERTHIVVAPVALGKTHCRDCKAEIRSNLPLPIGARVAVIIGTVAESYSSYVVENQTSETPEPCK